MKFAVAFSYRFVTKSRRTRESTAAPVSRPKPIRGGPVETQTGFGAGTGGPEDAGRCASFWRENSHVRAPVDSWPSLVNKRDATIFDVSSLIYLHCTHVHCALFAIRCKIRHCGMFIRNSKVSYDSDIRICVCSTCAVRSCTTGDLAFESFFVGPRPWLPTGLSLFRNNAAQYYRFEINKKILNILADRRRGAEYVGKSIVRRVGGKRRVSVLHPR